MQNASPRQLVAVELARQGFKVLACHHEGEQRKRPIFDVHPHGFKSATTDMRRIRDIWQDYPQALVGIVCEGFAVIDLDVKRGNDGIKELGDYLEMECSADLAGLVSCVVDTPSGGFHLYHRQVAGKELKGSVGKLPGVDIKADGGYVIAPDGIDYHLLDDASLAEMDTLPGWALDKLLALAKRQDRPRSDKRNSVAKHNWHLDADLSRFDRAAISGILDDIAQAYEGIRHDTVRDKVYKLASYVGKCFDAEEYKRLATEACKISGYWDADQTDCIELITSGLEKGQGNPKPEPRDEEPSDEDLMWSSNPGLSQRDLMYPNLTVNDRFEMIPKQGFGGKIYHAIKPCPRNLQLAFLKKGLKLSEDKFLRRRIIDGLEGDYECMLGDGARDQIRHLLENWFNLKFEDKPYIRAINTVAGWNKTDAYADFVNQQKWEGNLQLETVPMVFWGAADNIYSREIFRKMMVGACRRARYPGAKHDDILVLAGKGDLQKSLFVEAVSPFPEWYADFDMSWSGKERVENTMGLAVVEWAEMGGKRLRDDDHHKVTGSKRKDHVRLAWRYDPEIILTRHIIMATTNETGEFLTDPTGNRRYHPFEITNVIDVESFKIIQPQLWAEAAHLEERGYPNYLSKEAKALATANQEARQFKNNYITVLAEELNSICGWITLTGPWYLLGFRDKELNNRFEGQRVADAMSRLGWGRSQHDFKRGQGKVRCWHKPSQFGIPERCYRVTLDEDNRHPVVVQI